MRNYIQHSVKVMIAIALIALGSACKKSDSPEPPKPENGKVAIENAALVTALKEQGFTFEGNTLVVNDKVRTTTSLNLSGKQLTDVKGLEAFPALSEVNLSNNKFAQTFDFGTLPATVKSVNLSGNELYDFKNLATTDYSDNAQEPYKLIRSFDKLVLPATAKYNMDVLPAYVKLAPKSDVQMLNAQGTAEKYTTLREVPDPVLLRYIKQNFPSVITNDKIDISKNLKIEETQTDIVIDQAVQRDPNVVDTSKINNIEGIEYIFNNPRLSGGVFLTMTASKTITFPYVKIGKNVSIFVIEWINTPKIDFSNVEKLRAIKVSNNSSIQKINLSSSKTFMQLGAKGYDSNGELTALRIDNCPLLEEIIFPNLNNAPAPISASTVRLLNLPNLKSDINFSKLQVIEGIAFGGLPKAKIIYPSNGLTYFIDGGVRDDENGILVFEITKEIYNRPETQAFIKLIPKDKLDDGGNKHFEEAPNLTRFPYLQELKDNNETGRKYLRRDNSKKIDIFEHLLKKAKKR